MLICSFCRNEINLKDKKLVVFSDLGSMVTYGPHMSKSFPKWLRFPICENCKGIRSRTIKRDSNGLQLMPIIDVDKEYTQVTKVYQYCEYIQNSKNFHFMVKCINTLKKMTDAELEIYLNVIGVNVDVFFIRKFLSEY